MGEEGGGESLQYALKCGQTEWAQSQKRLGAWRCKDWHGLHESSYCYLKIYMGTRNFERASLQVRI